MPTEILTGARYPASSAAPNVAQDLQNAVQDLADNTTPAFATAAARNTAYSSWVSAGNTMRDGLTCAVAGFLNVYRSGQWRGVNSSSVSTGTFFATNITDGLEYGVANLSVPDPGFPYTVAIHGMVMVAADAATLTLIRVRLDSATGTQIGSNLPRSGALPAGESIIIPFSGMESAVLTGGHSIIPTVQRSTGTGAWGVGAAGNYLRVLINPA